MINQQFINLDYDQLNYLINVIHFVYILFTHPYRAYDPLVSISE